MALEKNLAINDLELNFEIEMTKDKLRELLNQLENAERVALPGQILRIKVHHMFCFTFRNVYKMPTNKGSSFQSEVTEQFDRKQSIELH